VASIPSRGRRSVILFLSLSVIIAVGLHGAFVHQTKLEPPTTANLDCRKPLISYQSIESVLRDSQMLLDGLRRDLRLDHNNLKQPRARESPTASCVFLPEIAAFCWRGQAEAVWVIE
jgi:hypothetical protein